MLGEWGEGEKQEIQAPGLGEETSSQLGLHQGQGEGCREVEGPSGVEGKT